MTTDTAVRPHATEPLPDHVNTPGDRLAQQLAAAVREIVALVVGADNQVTPQERRLALETVGAFAPGYGQADLRSDLSRSASAPLEQRLQYLGACLTAAGQEGLVRAAARVMIADGSVDPRERLAVEAVGEALGMAAQRVAALIDTAIDEMGRPAE
ncbi:MAG: TerB family tellurite resistance protein [Microthrixaceae bacterium]